MRRLALLILPTAAIGCGDDADDSPTAAKPTLTKLSTYSMAVGTHRPEILLGAQGSILLVVTEPDSTTVHRAYWFNQSLQQIQTPFVLTYSTMTSEDYVTYNHKPTDHRVAIVGDEIVIVYQQLKMNQSTVVPAGQPAEPYADAQSLKLARFTLTGTESFRTDLVTVPKQSGAQGPYPDDSFPDMCMLWRGDRLLIQTGSTGSTNMLKFREVSLSGSILKTVALTASASGIASTIGNSLVDRDGTLSILSATAPPSKAVLISRLDSGYTPTSLGTYPNPSRESTYPTGSLYLNGYTFVAYTSRTKTGTPDLLTNPYDAYLMILDSNLNLVEDIQVGTGGFAGVHPTMAYANGRLWYAWSKRLPSSKPQVQIEEFALTIP